MPVALRQELGGAASGGVEALFASGPPVAGAHAPGAEARWTLEAAYGLKAFGGRFTGTPHLGYGAAGPTRDYSVGWRLAPAKGGPPLAFSALLLRRESPGEPSDHGIGIELNYRW